MIPVPVHVTGKYVEVRYDEAGGVSATELTSFLASGDLASIVSADLVEFVVPNYGVNLLDLGESLEVRDPVFFTATLDGLLPSPGTVYTADPYEGADSLLPAYIAGTDVVIGYSTQRRLIAAVPEPSIMLVLTLELAGSAVARRWRR